MCLIRFSKLEESVSALANLHGAEISGRYFIFAII